MSNGERVTLADLPDLLGGHIMAHDVLLALLIYEMHQRNEKFKNECREVLDDFLGRLITERGGATVRYEAIARKRFLHLLDLVQAKEEELRKRPSLRRRFLRWLERG
jgi:hypothetical protein